MLRVISGRMVADSGGLGGLHPPTPALGGFFLLVIMKISTDLPFQGP